MFTSKAWKLPWAVYLLILLFLSHLPLLEADPHLEISTTSRDAFTDEGLNTNQVRNFVNHGTWDMFECDNLVKNPLFNAWLLPFLELFGTEKAVTRFISMLFGILLLMVISYFSKQFNHLIILLIPTTLLQYYLFQYEMFAMAEWGASCFILLNVYFLWRFLTHGTEKSKIKYLIFAALSSTAVMAYKIQFAYIQLLLPATLVIQSIISKKDDRVFAGFSWLIGLIAMILFNSLYLLIWYLPHNEVFLYVISHQTGGRFISNSYSLFLTENFERVFLTKYSVGILSAYLFSMVMGLFLIIQYKRKAFVLLWILLLLWSIIEFHKLFILYVPTRYVVSLYFSQGAFIALTLSECIFQIKDEMGHNKFLPKIIQGFALFMIAILLVINTNQLIPVFKDRQYVLRDAENYIKGIYKGEGSILGVWGTSIWWQKQGRTLPVWRNYHYDIQSLKKYPPAFIVTEWDQEDSNEAFKMAGIDLSELSKSKKEFVIGRYRLVVYQIL